MIRGENDVVSGVIGGVADAPELGEAEIEERKAAAAGGVPECYLDRRARLQCQWH